jgi:hypothetical protein
MDHTHSDIPGDESPFCVYCAKQTSIGIDVLAMRVGCWKVDDRGRAAKFLAEEYDDEEDVKWLHLSCAQMIFDNEMLRMFGRRPHEYDPDYCLFCPEHLPGEHLVFEFTVGQFGFQGKDTVWDPYETKRGRVIRFFACYDCVFFCIGEGDASAARQRLGMPPTAEDEIKWIERGESPEPEEVDQMPPHLRCTGRRPPPRRAIG